MPTQNHFADSPREVGLDPEKVEALFNRAEREVKDGLLPSTQIAIARNGKIGAMRTVGRAVQGGTEKPATNETLYTIFSCTKAIMSAASWILIGEGKLKPSERRRGDHSRVRDQRQRQDDRRAGAAPRRRISQRAVSAGRMARQEQAARAIREVAARMAGRQQVRIPSDVRLLGDRGDNRTPHRQGLSPVRARADFDAARTPRTARRIAARISKSTSRSFATSASRCRMRSARNSACPRCPKPKSLKTRSWASIGPT